MIIHSRKRLGLFAKIDTLLISLKEFPPQEMLNNSFYWALTRHNKAQQTLKVSSYPRKLMERDIGEEIIEKLQDILRKTQEKNKLANQTPTSTPKEQKYTPEDIERLLQSIERRLNSILDSIDKKTKEK